MQLSDTQFDRLADVCVAAGEVCAAGFFVPFFSQGASSFTAGFGLTSAVGFWILSLYFSR